VSTSVPKSNQLIDETFVYAFCERLLPWVPASVRPNHITLAGFSFGVAAACAYGLAGLSLSWLLVGVVAHLAFWLCDNLDGTVARHRGLTSVRGFFLDLTLDQVAYTLIYLAFGVSGIVLWPLAAGAGVLHLLHVHLIDMWIHLRGEEHFGKFGPTELTLIITASAVVTFVFHGPLVNAYGLTLRWFDVVAIVVIAAGAVEFTRSLLLLARLLPGPVDVVILREGRPKDPQPPDATPETRAQ
jgi:phosphatidylglycerophosphate synthase